MARCINLKTGFDTSLWAKIKEALNIESALTLTDAQALNYIENLLITKANTNEIVKFDNANNPGRDAVKEPPNVV